MWAMAGPHTQFQFQWLGPHISIPMGGWVCRIIHKLHWTSDGLINFPFLIAGLTKTNIYWDMVTQENQSIELPTLDV
jgi:hypothetical protein